MPYQATGSLSVDETYAVAAYILSLNGILPADGKLDKASLPNVKMPNRDGFIRDSPDESQTSSSRLSCKRPGKTRTLIRRMNRMVSCQTLSDERVS